MFAIKKDVRRVYALQVILIAICTYHSQSFGQENKLVAINVISCRYATGVESVMDDQGNKVFAPEFTIDTISGQQIIERTDFVNGKASALRFIGSANRGAFNTVSSAITSDEFQSISVFVDPYNTVSVFIQVTRVYLGNMHGFTSRMRFGDAPNHSMVYRTDLKPHKLLCKWKYAQDKKVIASNFIESPLDTNALDGGVLMNNGWKKIDEQVSP